MSTVQLTGNGFGGLVQGNYGTYQAASDGTWTVDTRDAPPLLTQGFAYVNHLSKAFTLPLAPAAATVATIVASGALSNGSVSIAANPDTMRQVTFEVGTGTTAITGGTATVTYIGNDGQSGSDVFPLNCTASTSVTQYLSRGVQTISAVTIAGLVGGTSPWRRMSTTTAVSVPVDPGAVDFTVTREYDAGATIAVGALVAASLGTITPTTAPNATVTYSFDYNFVAPVF